MAATLKKLPAKKATVSAAELLAGFQKDMGESVGSFGGSLANSDRIPTGLFPLDLALGGGFPRGRCSIIYGPESSSKTNIVLRAIASHQMLWPDKINVFFDIENSFDPDWAAQLGVQTDRLIVIKPGYAEQCVDMAESFLYSEDCGIVAIDSLAALVTTGELEASAEKGAFGGASMVTGKLARKTTLALQEAEKQGRYPSLFYVNQTRFKMGVMFGDPECVHADTMIPLTDGRSFSMRELCENKIEGSVWGYDPVTDTFAPQPIISHHFNGQAKDGDFVTIITNGHDIKNGFMGGTFSFTHKFLTPNGWTTAGELKAGDQLISKYVSTLNPTLAAFLDGVFVGDSTLTIQKQASIAGFRLNDKNDPDYLAWKVALLNEHLTVTQSTAGTRIAESVDIYRRYAGGVKRHPSTVLENFDPLSLAVWFMDDGYMDPRGRYTLCIGRARHDNDMRQYVCDMFVSRGFNCVWSKNGKNLVFSQIASEGIAQLIAPFVPPCMHRKVPDSLRTPGLQSLGEPLRSIRTTLVTVISAEPASKRKYRQRGLFDIHVGGRNTYLAGNPDNGFVVHNTMPGGNAPRFQASMWLRVYGKNVMDKSVSDVMPVIKEVNFVLKKWKCPVLAASGKFEMATQAYGGLQIGQCDDFGTVSEYLKTFGEFEKADKGKGWTICGEHYDTIQPFKTRLYEDAEFGAKIRHKIITTMLNQGVIEGDE